ncbi:alpha/beta fold hydrolase [Geoalkalibacter halelectricus]|uniref:Alpha/beta hydrolase n=1 Tax=Geoalkalibacter halelectricus TaxID=2847045 RepID=A0ABY5ZP98_9BACT|nr:alpha/beta hydrolase [Geoalkalibacter halelectricus]MDO3379927.1 alpha/beta hydrolase [Geoalkalibacter halelectricus]UWZ80546.1 alpha/beta hydrolase [Geoalkalibacter halelectricus]
MKARINGVQIGYDDFGKGPAVLFIHGYPLNRKMWRRQIEPLVNDGFRVILTDLSGFGESELREDAEDLHTHADDLVGLLNYLGVGRAVVCGISMGGYVLFDLLDRYPQRVAGACFVVTRPVGDDVQERVKRAELRRALENGETDRVREAFLRVLLTPTGRKKARSTDMREVCEWVRTADPRSMAAGLKAIGGRKDYTSLIKKLSLPTLVVGAELDQVIHPLHSELLARHLPNCFRAVSLKGGHLVNLEKFQAFNGHLLEFLRTLVPRSRDLSEPVEQPS